MKHYKHFFLLIFSIVFILAGCSGSKTVESGSFLERYEKGCELYDEGKYYKAIEHFTFVVYNAPGSDIADEAQFKLAKSHYNLKEYLIAIDEFKRLTLRWPASNLVEEAEFYIGECYFELSPIYQRDQSFTEKAIQHYQDFINTYPHSKYRKQAEERLQECRLKLAHKVFDAGKLYMILHEWEAAIITFEEIINEYYDTPLYQPTLLNMAECYKKIGDVKKLTEIYNKIDKSKLSSPQDRVRYNSLITNVAQENKR